MSQFEFESFPDGDWDDIEDVAWNEHDYRQFLKRHDREVARFISFYEKLGHRADRLDETARQMGWLTGDWNWIGPDNAFEDELDVLNDEAEIPFSSQEAESGTFEPYSLHKYPVFIGTRAIYQSLREIWEIYMTNYYADIGNGISSELAWNFAEKLQQGEINAALALQSLELGELHMVICLFKNSLAVLNQSLQFVQNLPCDERDHAIEDFKKQAHIRLFDLREMWLRVTKECRAVIQSRRQDIE